MGLVLVLFTECPSSVCRVFLWIIWQNVDRLMLLVRLDPTAIGCMWPTIRTVIHGCGCFWDVGFSNFL